MKKNSIYFIFFVLLCIVNINFCYATTYYASITGTDVNLRDGAGTSYSSIGKLTKGKAYKMVSNTKYTGTGCDSGWYNIYYDSSTTGYVCSTYVTVISASSGTETPSTDCEQEMYEAGFPSSYWSGLCALKESHSNWNFVALETYLDWTEAVEKESACGKSYIQTTNSEYIDSSCINEYGSSSSWKNASQTAVAYYMDPRNWLSENTIFQFEYLKYDSNLSSKYESAVTAIIKNAAFYTYHINLGNNLSSEVNKAGSATDVSPIFLASRMLQELGSGTSLYDLYSGVYTGYEGYYNFFNYGVSDSCATSNGTTYCGLKYAKDNWGSGIYNSIKGASSSLSSSYIAVGQYLLYLQKFNVVPTDSSKIYTHQYMTNIAAPSSEAKSMYSSYNSLDLLSSAFTFYIPVYLNMDETIVNSDSGGSGDDSSTGSSLSIGAIVKSAGFTYSSGYISGINPGTSVSDVINAIKAISGKNVTVKDTNGTSSTSGTIGTGYKVTVSNDTTSEALAVVIKGDTSGDGKINALDLLQVQKYILGTYTLSDAYLKAGDTSGDGKINALDLLQVQKHILGTYSIVQ